MIDGFQPDEGAGALDDVFSSDRDRGGDFAPPDEQPSGQPRDERGRFASQEQQEPEAQTPPVEQEQPEQPPSSETQQPAQDRHVPLSALTEERKKYQSRIDEMKAEMDQRVHAAVQQAMQQYGQQFQQQPQQQVEVPDIFEDPDTAIDFRVNRQLQPFQHQMMQMMDQTRFAMAQTAYGADLVNEAVEAANKAGLNDHFLQQSDPYGAVVQWHKQAKTLQEVGDDPAAYRQRVEQEIRQKVLEEMKAGNGQTQQQHFPSTLADRTSAGQGASGSLAANPEALMDAMFQPDRNRRPRQF